jgi:alpha-galactosidase
MAVEHWRIEGGGAAVLFRRVDGAPPELVFWGEAAAAGADDARLADRPVPHGMLDHGERLDLFPEAGRGFNGHPAILHHRAGLHGVSQLELRSATVAADHVQFELADERAGLGVALSCRLHPEGVLALATTVTNTGPDPLELAWAAGAVLPCPYRELMLFEGRWAQEFQTVRQRLETGALVQENRTGRTSHHAPPFLFAGSDGFGEDAGEVWALHLAWSGNSRLLAERLRDGRVQLQAGELLAPGEVILQPGERYTAPTAYAARSTAGLNGLSARLHAFVRRDVLAGRTARPRPVTFNTWEAVYFQHEVQALKALANEAAAVGVERFVLDDGWFKGRDDDTTSLGDWTVDPDKYPDGLAPLADHVRALGMKFGLWVEPEMANADSYLLRAHPDWVLGESGREQPLGRGQYVLDLTRSEVADDVFGQLHRLLSDLPIDYLKWDMNRDLTHAVSRGRPAAGAQTRAAYALIDRLKAAHPDVEIESCASGGARADYEILKRTERIWTSDCNDPIDRQRIQRGFSLVFPPEVMGAHVGPRRAHTTGRETSLEFRAATALFGHMGIEGDLRAFSEAEREQLARWIALHKQFRPLLHQGRSRRLAPEDPGLIAFSVESGAERLVSAAQVETPLRPVPANLRLTGLESGRRYRAELLNPLRQPERAMKQIPSLFRGEPLTASGAALAGAGLPLPVLRVGEIALFHLEAL